MDLFPWLLVSLTGLLFMALAYGWLKDPVKWMGFSPLDPFEWILPKDLNKKWAHIKAALAFFVGFCAFIFGIIQMAGVMK